MPLPEGLASLGRHDVHLVLDAGARRLDVWNAEHHRVFTCEARNRTTADGQFGHDGNCPPGEFLLGPPSPRGTVPFGAWFIPMLDYDDFHAMALHRRAGIGIHGGGSGLPAPFTPLQGWQITHGCWRVQNRDLAALVQIVATAQADGGRCYVTVSGPTPAAAPEPDDWGPVPELAPDE